MGFMHLRIKFKENFKPKTKLIKVEISILDKSRKNFFSYQMQFKVLKMALDLATLSNNQNLLNNLALEIFFHFAFKEEHKKWGWVPF